MLIAAQPKTAEVVCQLKPFSHPPAGISLRLKPYVCEVCRVLLVGHP